jgi:hypothetical protein
MNGDTPDEQNRIVRFNPSGFEVEIPTSVVARTRRDGSGMMDDGELRCLAGVTLAFPWSPEALVVEIGSYAGTTAAFLAETLADAGIPNPVLSIDPFERVAGSGLNPRGRYRKYVKTMRSRGLQDRCFALVAYSHDAAVAVPDRIGLLIIDGNHEYESVARDLELFAPKVLPGGFIFLDDYTDTYPGVRRATDEYAVAHSNWEVLHRSYFAILRRAPG